MTRIHSPPCSPAIPIQTQTGMRGQTCNLHVTRTPIKIICTIQTTLHQTRTIVVPLLLRLFRRCINTSLSPSRAPLQVCIRHVKWNHSFSRSKGLLTICPTYFNTNCPEVRPKKGSSRSVVVSDVCFGTHAVYGTPARQFLYVERVYPEEGFETPVCLK
jgi:hypothetical protein